MKSLLEVQNTNNSEWMLLNIILSDFQQYRALLAKVFVSPEKCENQRYKFLTPDRRYTLFHLVSIYFLPGAKLTILLKVKYHH